MVMHEIAEHSGCAADQLDDRISELVDQSLSSGKLELDLVISLARCSALYYALEAVARAEISRELSKGEEKQ